MPKYRQALPGWALKAALAYVRGYGELLAWQEAERLHIMLGRRGCQAEIVGGAAAGAGRPVETAAQRLLELERHPNARILAAVGQALCAAGAGIADAGLREGLRRALLFNCADGRGYPFECFELDGIDRNAFYRRRRLFLYEVARLAGLIGD